MIGNDDTVKTNSIEFNKDNEEAKEIFEKIKKAHEKILKIKESKPGEPKFTYYGHGKEKGDFSMYTDLGDFERRIEEGKLTIDQAIKERNTFHKKYKALEKIYVEK